MERQKEINGAFIKLTCFIDTINKWLKDFHKSVFSFIDFHFLRAQQSLVHKEQTEVGKLFKSLPLKFIEVY